MIQCITNFLRRINMTQEEKARAYDEVLKQIKECTPDENGFITIYPQEIFPELKEPEDEKVRKEIIDFLKLPHPQFVGKRDHEKWIAWLEKQDIFGKKDVDDAYLKGVRDTKNEIEKQYEANYQTRKDIATFIFNYRGDIKDRAKWMDYLGIKVSFVGEQGEQKPSIQFKPKFEVGDWLVHNERKHIIKVVNHTPLVYEVVNILGHHHTITNTAIENNYHLWTLEDAKDGDVLAVEPIDGYPSSFVAIFKERGLDFFNSHCFIGFDGNFYKGEEGHNIENIHPATKEQRDLLFQKMYEAGYTWDDKKKELKVEPIFNVGDKIQYLKGCGAIMTIEKIENGEYIFTNNMGHTTIENGNKCYLVERKPAEWHREDEQNLNACLGYIPDEFLRRWLKDVVHAKYDKPAWSEDDEKFFKTALWHISYSISNGKGTDIHCDTTEWLKSLKERIIS